MFFSEEDIKDLRKKARLNVSNNSGSILQEINRLVSSSHTKEFWMWGFSSAWDNEFMNRYEQLYPTALLILVICF